MGTTIREALAAANKKLMGKIDDAMNNEVFKEIQDEEAATIYEVIYKVYTPRMYRRRGEYGGSQLNRSESGRLYERGTGDDREKSSRTNRVRAWVQVLSIRLSETRRGLYGAASFYCKND